MRLIPLLLVVLLTGCGPVRSTIGLVDAERALREAQDAGSVERAPYQTAMAEELLDKAREAQGRSTYDDSMYLANESMTWATRARDVATGAVEAPTPEPLPDLGSEETPAEETPAEETPAEETPAEETPAEETPAEETPAEETPAEETPTEPAEAEPTDLSGTGDDSK